MEFFNESLFDKPSFPKQTPAEFTFLLKADFAPDMKSKTEMLIKIPREIFQTFFIISCVIQWQAICFPGTEIENGNVKYKSLWKFQ